MDRNFLEFWGNYLLAVAKGQKQMEDFSRWMKQGFQGAEELTEMFQKVYGLDPKRDGYAESWEKAARDFRLAFRESFLQMGWVPREDYDALAEENQHLQQKLDRQEEQIKRLRRLLSDPGADQTQTLKVFQELIQKQGAEFSKLMRKLSEPEDG
ncbi:MAG TPA: hypothetical protein ACFCUC_11930 [Desulfobacterales bacterium]